MGKFEKGQSGNPNGKNGKPVALTDPPPWKAALEKLSDPYTRGLRYKLAQLDGSALDKMLDAQIELAQVTLASAGGDSALLSIAERARKEIADRIDGTPRQRQEIVQRTTARVTYELVGVQGEPAHLAARRAEILSLNGRNGHAPPGTFGD